MKVTTFTVGEFQENCYLVQDDASRAAIIDPGGEPARLVAAVEQSGARLEAIWVTHAHIDHVGAVAAVKKRWVVPVRLHPADQLLYSSVPQQAALYGLRLDEPPPPDADFTDGDVLEIGDLRFSVMHAPGHSPGHVVIHGNGVAFVGDCIFAGSVGRTDLPGSSGPDLRRTLEKIAALPGETIVYPGHGPPTTIADEQATNPFLTGAARIPL